jgi:hypothetical protein
MCFGSVPAGDEENLVKIAVGAVRAGFAVVPCVRGTSEPQCTLTAQQAKKEPDHHCYHPLTSDTMARTVINRLTKDGKLVNLAIDLGLSGMAVLENCDVPGTTPTVTVGQDHYHWFEVPEGVEPTADVLYHGHMLVPPSILDNNLVMAVGQTNPLPKELREEETAVETNTVWDETDADQRVEELQARVELLEGQWDKMRNALKVALGEIAKLKSGE